MHHPLAPLAHPLPTALGAVLSPLGPAGAHDALSVLAAFSFGLLLLGAFELARALFPGRGGIAAGLLAAALLLALDRPVFFALAATVDIPFVALVLGALWLAIARRGEPWAPLGLLVAAGLLRPESWLLGPAYCGWLYLGGSSGRRLAWCAALAAAPVVLWLIFAAAAVGDALSPLKGNPDAIPLESIGFPSPSNTVTTSGPGPALEAVIDGLRSVIGVPLALAGGAAAAWALGRAARSDRPGRATVSAAIAAGAAVVLLLTSVLFTAAGATFTDRYALAPGVILVALAAAALWWLPRAAAVAAGVALVAMVLTGVGAGGAHAPTLPDARSRLSFAADQRREQEDLYELASRKRVDEAIAGGCDRVTIGGEGGASRVLYAKPLVAQALDLGPEEVAAIAAPPQGPKSADFVRELHGAGPRLTSGSWAFEAACLAGAAPNLPGR